MRPRFTEAESGGGFLRDEFGGGCDFTFSPPKSVSLAGFLGRDNRILEAHARAVNAAVRARKQRDLSRAELLDLWEAQLTRDERQAISRLRDQSAQSPSDDKRMSLADAVQWAEEHLFDRNSVALECQVWQEALGRARGESFSVSELAGFTRQRGYIRDEARPGEVSLRDVLLREWEIVQTRSS
jgi:hypothetical protein